VKWIHSESATGWRPPEDRAPLRVAMIGAGKMARLHSETVRAIPSIVLCGVSSRTEASASRLQSEFGYERAYTDHRRMLDELQPDAVFVAVSHATSFEVACDVLQRRVPCLLEKPAAYSAVDARVLVDLAERGRVLTLVAVNRRYYSVVQQAALAINQYGPIRGVLVESHEPTLAFRSRMQFDSWLYDRWLLANSIHAIDLLRMIGGEVEALRGFGAAAAEPFGDHFSIATRHQSGALGTFVAHWNSAGGVSMKIYGDGVEAELESLESGFVRYATGRRIKIPPDNSDTRFKPGLYAQNVAFLASVCDNLPAPYPASDVADHCRTIQLVEDILGTVHPEP